MWQIFVLSTLTRSPWSNGRDCRWLAITRLLIRIPPANLWFHIDCKYCRQSYWTAIAWLNQWYERVWLLPNWPLLYPLVWVCRVPLMGTSSKQTTNREPVGRAVCCHYWYLSNKVLTRNANKSPSENNKCGKYLFLFYRLHRFVLKERTGLVSLNYRH